MGVSGGLHHSCVCVATNVFLHIDCPCVFLCVRVNPDCAGALLCPFLHTPTVHTAVLLSRATLNNVCVLSSASVCVCVCMSPCLCTSLSLCVYVRACGCLRVAVVLGLLWRFVSFFAMHLVSSNEEVHLYIRWGLPPALAFVVLVFTLLGGSYLCPWSTDRVHVQHC